MKQLIIQFLKPDWRKIAIFAILAVILFNIDWWWIPECCEFFYYQGLPIPVYYEGGFARYPKTFILIGFVIDVVIWYVLSCLIAWIYDKLRKKHQ